MYQRQKQLYFLIYIEGFYLLNSTSSTYTSTYPFDTNGSPAPNGFGLCSSCNSISGTNGRCESCYNVNSTNCDSCYGWITPGTSGNTCTLYPTTAGNCSQGVPNNTAQCATCQSGWYVNNTNLCASCNLYQCQRCVQGTCQQCNAGYYNNIQKKSSNCTQCTVANDNNIFSYIDYRCNSCNQTQPSNCTYCNIGYMNSSASSDGTKCSLKCGSHQYPQVIYQTVNSDDTSINATICSECPSTCSKCISSDPVNGCTECPTGYYLSITNPITKSGQCVQKQTASTTPSFDIYVTNNVSLTASNPWLRDGSALYPLIDLQDALVRAKELASQYTNTVQINIYLAAGTHYMLRNRNDSAQIYTVMQYYDPFNLNFQVNINPQGCVPSSPCNAAKVTVLNKRREAFYIDVGVMLHLRNVIIDSLDSILPSSNTCLNQYRQCCSITSTGVVSNVLTTDTFSCSTLFQSQQQNSACNSVNSPRTMFRMLLNNQNQVTAPNQVIIENSTIQNVFYDMNSLINLTVYGGNVTLLGSVFDKISICGAIVKNYFATYPIPNLSSLTSLTTSQTTYVSQVQTIQQTFYDSYYTTYLQPPSSSPFSCSLSAGTCFTLNITGTNFTNFQLGMSSQQTLNVVTNDNGLRYQGSVLNLYNFQGDILIQDSNFKRHLFNYDNCDNLYSTFVDNPTSTSTYTLNPNSVYNLYQLKSIISVMNHSFGIYLMNNNFTNNTAFKGILNLEVQSSRTKPVVMYGNYFSYNGALIDSNVVNLRIINTVNLLGSSYTSQSDLRCGGVEILSNQFIKNSGCYKANGAIYLYCYDSSQSQNASIIKYVQSYDSQYFIGNSSSYALINNIDVSTITQTYQTTQYTPSVYTTNSATTIQTPMQQVTLRNNTYDTNFAGQNQSIVNIQGIPLLNIDSETYRYNQNWFNNSFVAYSPFYQIQSNKAVPTIFSQIYQANLTNFQLKAASIVQLIRPLSLLVNGTTFSTNYISSSNTNQITTFRSSGILLIDFIGYFTINQGSGFFNNTGISGISQYSSLLQSDIQLGFKTSLLTYERCLFVSMMIYNVTFFGNRAYYDTTIANLTTPYLFIVNSAQLAPSFKWKFSYINITNNTFQNGQGMMFFDISNLVIDNSVFAYNGDVNYQTNIGMLFINISDGYSVSLVNNTFSNIYTNGLAAVYFIQNNTYTSSGAHQSSISISGCNFTTINGTGGTGSRSSSVIVDGINANWTGNYSLNFTLKDTSFYNIRSQKTSSAIYFVNQTLQASYYRMNITAQNVSVNTTTSGAFIYLGAQNLNITNDAYTLISISNSSIINMTNGSMLLLDALTMSNAKAYISNLTFQNITVNQTYNQSVISLAYRYFNATNGFTDIVNVTNSTFQNISTGSIIWLAGIKANTSSSQLLYNFYNDSIKNVTLGSVFNISALSLNSSGDIFLNVTSSNDTYYNVTQGGVFNISDGVTINSTSGNFYQYVYLNNTNFTTIGYQPFYHGSAIIGLGGNCLRNITINNCSFNGIGQRAFEFGNLSIVTQGSSSFQVLVLNISIQSLAKSGFYQDARNISSNGGYFQNITVSNSFFTSTSNQNDGVVRVKNTSITTNSTIQTYINFLNTQFQNSAQGNGYAQGYTTLNAKGNILESVNLQNLTYSNFLQGVGFEQDGGNITTQGTLTQFLNLYNCSFTNFATQSTVSIGNYTISSVGAIIRNLTVNATNIKNTLSNGIQINNTQIASTSSLTTNQYIVNSNFVNVSNNGIQLDGTIATLTGGVNKTVIISGCAFSLIGYNGIQFGSSGTVTSNFYNTLINVTGSSFDQVSLQSIYIPSKTFYLVSDYIQSINVNTSSFTNMGQSGILVDTSTITLFGLYYKSTNISSNQFNTLYGTAISFGNLTVNNSTRYNDSTLIQSNNFTGVSGDAYYTGYAIVNATTYINSTQLYQLNQFKTISGNAFSLLGENFTAGTVINKNLTLKDSTFSTLTLSALNISQSYINSSNNYTSNITLQNLTLSNLNGSIMVVSSQQINSTYNTSLAIQILNISAQNITSSCFNMGTLDATINGTLNKTLIINNITMYNLTKSGLTVGVNTIYVNGTTILNSSITNSSLSLVGNDGFRWNNLTVFSNYSIYNQFSIMNNQFANVTMNATYFAYQVLNGSTSIYNIRSYTNNTFTNISQSAIAILQRANYVMNGPYYDNLTFISNTFKNISQSALVIFDSIYNASLDVNIQKNFSNNVFNQVGSNIYSGIQVQQRNITSTSGQVIDLILFQNNSFPFTSGFSGVLFGSMYSYSKGNISQNITIVQNTFNYSNGNAIWFGNTNVTTLSNYTKDVLISNNSFYNINGSAVVLPQRNISAQGLLNDSMRFTQNLFYNISRNAIQIASFNLYTTLGPLISNLTLYNQQMQLINNTAIYIQTINCTNMGSNQTNITIFYINNTNASNLYQGMQIDSTYIFAPSSQLNYTTWIYNSSMNTITNASIALGYSNLTFSTGLIQTVIQYFSIAYSKYGIDFGTSNITSTLGSITNNQIIQSSQIQNIASIGLTKGQQNISSKGDLNTFLLIYNSTFYNLTNSAYLQDSTYYQTSGQLSVSLNITQSTIKLINQSNAIDFGASQAISSTSISKLLILNQTQISNINNGSAIVFSGVDYQSSTYQNLSIVMNEVVISSIANGSGVILNDISEIYAAQNFTKSYQFTGLVLQNIKQRGIVLGSFDVTTLQNVSSSLLLSNCSIKSLSNTGLSIGTINMTSSGYQTIAYVFENSILSDISAGNGIYVYQYNLQSDKLITLNMEFNNLTFNSLTLGDGVYYGEQYFNSLDSIAYDLSIQDSTFSNILSGSGLEMNLITASAVDLDFTIDVNETTFNQLNSPNEGTSLRFNFESVDLTGNYDQQISIYNTEFTSIDQGAAFRLREYMMNVQKNYIETFNWSNSTVSVVSQGIGIQVIKDSITVGGDYTCDNKIESSSKFDSITSMYKGSAILFQESYIMVTGDYNYQTTLSDSYLEYILNGPTMIFDFNYIQANSYSNELSFDTSNFTQLSAEGNSSVLINQLNIYSGSTFLSNFVFDTTGFTSMNKGSAIRTNNQNITWDTDKTVSMMTTFTNCYFSNITTDEDAAIEIREENLYEDKALGSFVQLKFSSTQFYNNTGTKYTSILYVDSTLNQATTIDTCIITNNTGPITNDIYFGTINSLTITNIKWYSNGNQQNQAMFLYKNIYDYSLTITNSQFKCNVVLYTANQTLINNYQQSSLIDMASLFVFTLQQDTKLTTPQNQLTSNQYLYCNLAYQGGVYQVLNGSQVSDTSPTYQYNSALKGGIAFISGYLSAFQLYNTAQVKNSYAYYGGVFYVENSGIILADYVSFLSNSATEGAIAYLQDNSVATMTTYIRISQNTAFKRAMIVLLSSSQMTMSCLDSSRCSINLNVVNQDSAFLYMSNVRERYQFTNGLITKSYSTTLTNVDMQQNTVNNGGQLITVLDGNLYLQTCNIYTNYIYETTEGILGQFANIWINNSVFYDAQKDNYYTEIVSRSVLDVSGAFVQIGQNSSLSINTTRIQGGRALYGGCVAIFGGNNITITNVTFTSCAANLGGSIYAVDYQSLQITNSTFQQNIAFRGYGQNIYSQSSKLNLTINGCIFYSYHNSIYFQDGKLFYLNNNQFLNEGLRVSQIPNIQYAGGLHIINAATITFGSDTTSFTGLTGQNGGAIYVSVDLNFKAITQLKYQIQNVNILNCVALANGGGIYIRYVNNMTISGSTIQGNNATSGLGGGIYFECYKSQSDICSVSLKGTKVTLNNASSGGGIYWNWRKPTIDSSELVLNNYGINYGQDWGSFARELVVLPDSDTYLMYFNNQSKTKIQKNYTLTAYTYTNVQSGNFIPAAYYALIDDEDQVVTTNSGAEIEYILNYNKIGDFVTEVSGVNEFFSAFGVFNVSGLFIVSAPNSTQTMRLDSVSAIDTSQPTVQSFIQSTFPSDTYEIAISLIVRGCILGEGLLDSGACYECPKGTYLLYAPTVPTQCKVCDAQKAICQGGADIGPQAGYWRKDNITENFLACLEPIACLGMIAPDYNPVGDCETGYYGALCSACMPGYARSGSYGCDICPNPVMNMVRIIGIIIAAILAVGYMVKGTIASAGQKNTHSVYFKIFLNHLQLLGICAAFKFQWPQQVTSLLSSGSVIQTSSDAIVSFDCWMDTRNASDIQRYVFHPTYHEMRVIYQKALIMAGLPILIGIFVSLTWIVILKYYKQFNQFETKSIASLVVIFFLVHPTITQAMIDLFNCQDFDGDNRLMEDPQILCYQDLHTYMAYFVALPCIFLWGIGIPAAVWYLMMKDVERLDTLAVKQKFGFLYEGYKRNNFFWEIVIMYRKISMIGVAVFMNRIGIIVQALVMLLFMVFCLQINNMRRPYGTRALNDIEDLSLMTGIITIYCAIFFISSRDPTLSSFNPSTDFYLDNTGQLILFGIIVFANVAFIATWLIKFISVLRLLIKERYQKIYVSVFLCCRKDKLEKENEQLARIRKNENTIEKIEEMQFFLKNMKNMYTRQIAFEGHQRFLRILYYLEFEKNQIDMTEKKHNFKIQGKMARDRKFDPERMKQILDQRSLKIDKEFLDEQEEQSNKRLNEDDTRKSKYQRSFSMFKKGGTLSKINRQSMEDVKSNSMFSDLTQKIKDAKNREVNSQLDLEETRAQIKLNDTKDNLEDSQQLDDTSRGLLFSGLANKLNFLQQRPSSELVFNKDLDQDSKDVDSQAPQNISKQKQPVISHMQDKLLRSRNAYQKLNKDRKYKIEVEGTDDQENYSRDRKADTHGSLHKLSTIGLGDREQAPNYNLFTEVVQGDIISADEDNEESMRQRRIERGLTYKQNMVQSKTKRRQSERLMKMSSKKQSSPRSSAKRRDSLGEKNVDISFDFVKNDPMKLVYDTGKITQTNQPAENQKEEKKRHQEEVKQERNKKFTIKEIMKMTKMGMEWGQQFEYQGKMRKPTDPTREIMIDNFCQVKEVHHDSPNYDLKQSAKNIMKRKMPLQRDMLNVSLELDLDDGEGEDEEQEKQQKQQDKQEVQVQDLNY